MSSKGKTTPKVSARPAGETVPAKTVIRVVLVTPRPIIRSALHLLIDQDPQLRVVGEVSDLSSPDAIGVELGINGVLLIEMEDDDRVLEALPEFLSRSDRVKAIVLVRQQDSAAHVRALRSGAMGVVLKERASTSLAAAIQKVHAGEVWLDRALMARVLGEISPVRNGNSFAFERQPSDSLTPREREVVSLIGEGLRNKHIAAQLFISETTVRHHLTSIFGKLNVHDRCELVVFAFRHGLSSLSQQHPTPSH